MNKKELVKELAGKVNMTQKDTAIVVDAFVEVLTETLVKGERIQLTGFGAFDVKQREARVGHNPQTGEKIEISARIAPVFKASANLKELINAQFKQDNKGGK